MSGHCFRVCWLVTFIIYLGLPWWLCGVEDSWESLGLQRDQTSQSQRKFILNIHWKDRCWSWLQYFGHLRRRAGSLEKTLTLGKIEGRGEDDDRGRDGWMASLIQRTWVWAISGRWWWTGKPGMLGVHDVAKSQTWLSDWAATTYQLTQKKHFKNSISIHAENFQ